MTIKTVDGAVRNMLRGKKCRHGATVTQIAATTHGPQVYFGGAELDGCSKCSPDELQEAYKLTPHELQLISTMLLIVLESKSG